MAAKGCNTLRLTSSPSATATAIAIVNAKLFAGQDNLQHNQQDHRAEHGIDDLVNKLNAGDQSIWEEESVHHESANEGSCNPYPDFDQTTCSLCFEQCAGNIAGDTARDNPENNT